MQADMVLHGLAKPTQKVYIAAVAGIAKYYHRSLDLISPDEIKQYLRHLIPFPNQLCLGDEPQTVL
jgi:hypothetical protein